MSFAPALERLGKDTAFLKDYLQREQLSRDFQTANNYRHKGVILLAHQQQHFEVRLTEWTADPASDMYEDTYAHTHRFDLLTYGTLGPGYRTTVYEVDPAELQKTPIGGKITIRHTRVEQLHQGRLMYYPAFTVAHVQHPADDYSLSVGLVLYRPPNPSGHTQYFIDPVTSTRQLSQYRQRSRKIGRLVGAVMLAAIIGMLWNLGVRSLDQLITTNLAIVLLLVASLVATYLLVNPSPWKA